MTRTADVVVIGGGVNGVSIAHALAGRGVKVTLVEKGALAGGASGRSSALVRMHYTNEWDARLAWASFPIFRHWPELMGGAPVFTHHRQPAREEGPVGVRHVLLETAHAAHVLLVVHAVNHAAGAEEHQRFEERVRHHVKDADHERAHAASHEHETKLGYGRVGQDFLNVVLRDANRCSEDRCGSADERDDQDKQRAQPSRDLHQNPP